MKPTLKVPGTKRLKLEYDGLLSNFAFKFNLRRYSEGNAMKSTDPGDADAGSAAAGSTTTLKQYIQSFDQAALADTARIVSVEGVVLAERQTGALFGSIEVGRCTSTL